MVSLMLAVAIFSAAFLATDAGGHGQGQGAIVGESGSRMARGGWGGQSGQGGQQASGWQGQGQGRSQQGGYQGRSQQGGYQGRSQQEDQGYGMQQGAGGRQGGSDGTRYRANILDDEDVYGYEAKYPNGEAMYVNYRNSDARARRGPEFARSNSISARMSSRMSEHGQQNVGYRQQRGAAADMMSNQQQHPQW